jgi:hypothetical protein
MSIGFKEPSLRVTILNLARRNKLDKIKSFILDKCGGTFDQISTSLADECCKIFASFARDGNLEVVKCFVDMKIPTRGTNGLRHVITGAIFGGQLHIVKYLIESGYETYEDIFVEKAAFKGQLEIVKFLIGDKDLRSRTKKGILKAAITRGHIDVAQYLFGLNFHIGFRDKLLGWAVFSGELAIVRYIVEKNFTILDTSDDDIASMAAEHGFLPIIYYLVELGFDFRPPESEALELAALSGHFETVRFLADFDDFDVEDMDINPKYEYINDILLSMGAEYNRAAKRIFSANFALITEKHVLKCRELDKICRFMLELSDKKYMYTLATNSLTQRAAIIICKDRIQKKIRNQSVLKFVLKPKSLHLQMVYFI